MIKQHKRISVNYNDPENKIYIEDCDDLSSILYDDFLELGKKVKKARELKDKKIYIYKGIAFPKDKLKGLIKVTKDPDKADYIVMDYDRYNIGGSFVYIQNNTTYTNFVGSYWIRKILNKGNSYMPIDDEEVIKYYRSINIFDDSDVDMGSTLILNPVDRAIFQQIINTDKFIDISVLRSFVESQNDDMTQEALDNIGGLLSRNETTRMGLEMLSIINIENNKASVYWLLSKYCLNVNSTCTRLHAYKNIMKILDRDLSYGQIDTRWMVRHAGSEFDKQFAKKTYLGFIERDLQRWLDIEQELLQELNCAVDLKIIDNGRTDKLQA
jgi:hypothetical protein